MLSSVEEKLVRKLLERYDSNVTLGDLLKECEGDKQPIQDVTFDIEGIYDDAYELTGDEYWVQGTIPEIFSGEFNSKLLSKEDESAVPLTKVLSESEIGELALFFLGEREEHYVIYTRFEQSRTVTQEEIVDYLKTLYVHKDFEYEQTVKEF